MSEPVNFTANAAAKVWELIQEEGNPNLKLRVYVTGGDVRASLMDSPLMKPSIQTIWS